MATLLALTTAGGCKPPQASLRPNIVLVLVDALRADHLGSYGYGRDTTPVIDELARTGLRFEQVISQSSWTLPSLISLFTTKYPPTAALDQRAMRGRFLALADEEVTLAEILSDNGYRTLSVATNPFNRDRLFGTMQGFDVNTVEISAAADWVIERAVELIGEHMTLDPERPFFLYLHLMDVHTPYEPPADYDGFFPTLDGAEHRKQHHHPSGVTSAAQMERRQWQIDRSHTVALYDGALRFLDSQLGRLLEFLAERKIRDQTIVAVVSDHGEELWDHAELEIELGLSAHERRNTFGVGHGHTLFPELVRVPLILNGPGIPAGTVSRRVRNLDVAPTLLALASLEPAALAGHGEDLMPLLGQDAIADLPALTATTAWQRRQVALFGEGHQLLRLDGQALLFDEGDAALTDRAAEQPEVLATLQRRLDSTLATAARARVEDVPVDAKMLERLRALGYTR